ncbi:hypothetical protein GCM10027321_12380 [Massilia terrae]|uniref:Uncharacterized protein n=1 Tax=Massilia terrae TaxID=1811224 RepID=A0ABT2D2Y1_9BURK|nr:hypothetical protein [Massilia terrae]MCS0660469.1 hypothetical protein [Massilia terrae]
MKHRLPILILAGATVAAVLSACGGSGAPPATGMPQFAAQLTAVPVRAVRLYNSGDPSAPATPPLQLTIADGQAKVCQRKTNDTLVCAQVGAALPPATAVNYWRLPDGTDVLTYTRAPGVAGIPDPDAKAAVAFQAAFNGAARAVQAYSASLPRTLGRLIAVGEAGCETAQDDDSGNCTGNGEDPGGGDNAGGIPVVTVTPPPPDPGLPTGGSSGGGTSDPPTGTPDGSGNDTGDGRASPQAPVVVVHGTPDPVASIPIVIIPGTPFADLLPPTNPVEQLAAGAPNSCVNGGIIVVCIRGTRPPSVVGEPQLPSGPTPWFPQSWCDWAHIFCSAGQVPRAPNPTPAPGNQSWPNQEKFNQCMDKARARAKECIAMKDLYPVDATEQCIHEAAQMVYECNLLYGNPTTSP